MLTFKIFEERCTLWNIFGVPISLKSQYEAAVTGPEARLQRRKRFYGRHNWPTIIHPRGIRDLPFSQNDIEAIRGAPPFLYIFKKKKCWPLQRYVLHYHWIGLSGKKTPSCEIGNVNKQIVVWTHQWHHNWYNPMGALGVNISKINSVAFRHSVRIKNSKIHFFLQHL